MKCIVMLTLVFAFVAAGSSAQAATGDQMYAHPGRLVQEIPDTNWLIAHRRSFGDRPLVVLTAQDHYYDSAKTPPAIHKKHLASEREHALTQARLLSLSTDAKQVLVPNSGHYIQLDQPQIVINAILGELPKHASQTP